MRRSRGGGDRRGGEVVYHLVAPPLIAFVRLVTRICVRGDEHVPRRGPVLLAANHVSRLDPLVLGAVLYRLGRPVRFLAVSGLFDIWYIGPVFRATRMIPVVRGGGPERMAEDTLPSLAAGEAVVVYPEGTIPAPGETLPARPGAGLLALRAQVPVIPVAIWGLRPEEHRPRSGRWRRPVRVTFGPPLDLSPWKGRLDRDGQLEAGEAILAAVRAMLPPGDR